MEDFGLSEAGRHLGFSVDVAPGTRFVQGNTTKIALMVKRGLRGRLTPS